MFLIPHVGTIIWTTIIFLIVYFVLSKFAWKPLLKALEERETNIDEALKSADEAKRKLTHLEKEQQQIVHAAKQEKESLIKEGILQRDKILAEAKEKALQQTEKMIDDAHRRIVMEREAAMVEMKNQIALLSVEIATKVVKAEMEDRKRHEKLVEELIKEIELN
jgi:F-type H+-transporting ATPase subunit b